MIIEFASLDETLRTVGRVPMTSPSSFHSLTTDELVARFKATIVQGHPPQELVDELASRPGIAFIQVTDSTATTINYPAACSGVVYCQPNPLLVVLVVHKRPEFVTLHR